MRLLVLRTSAMGDVALTIPVLSGINRQYPDIEMILLTRSDYESFFNSIEKLHLFFPDLQNRHKGFIGLIRLYRDLSKQAQIDHVIDLHDVLRSKILRFLFLISGVPVSVIDKGRIQKKSIISGKTKGQLKHTVERYCMVFEKAGFPVVPSKDNWIVPTSEGLRKARTLIQHDEKLNIGVAPFAKHKLKMWPLENTIKLLNLISNNYSCRFWLFGGSGDSEKMAVFQKMVPDSINLTCKFNLDEELAIMSMLDMMIAMDSSNMHMAALVGTKVISIWGGTDPLTGFGAWMQPAKFAIRIPTDELECRPCTIYGKGECKRGDFACMLWLTPEKVFNMINKLKIWE